MDTPSRRQVSYSSFINGAFHFSGDIGISQMDGFSKGKSHLKMENPVKTDDKTRATPIYRKPPCPSLTTPSGHSHWWNPLCILPEIIIYSFIYSQYTGDIGRIPCIDDWICWESLLTSDLLFVQTVTYAPFFQSHQQLRPLLLVSTTCNMMTLGFPLKIALSFDNFGGPQLEKTRFTIIDHDYHQLWHSP